MCSLWLIVTIIANPPELNLGQEVIHDDLQTSHYDVIYKNTLNPKIGEVMVF
jgi:hypothetical protein